ncbi:23S rRNA (adenine(2030)-N(6))-methyltransferase RlmJ [Hyphococcus sp.]|uniref:23S rRNA (adenine(2030)-N(6))-methyltransferase RlmJ n=1 Tax=Hyphococcus sp. TaxID=2038636 RepID=UPI00208D644C|nr:MAG: ribosomal RNA large subunit methyltransferase J [Marinicaulis sp.]
MNYRHAYHAGNHADVLKHVILARIIEHMKQKDAPFRIFDAHGGIGVYDLGGVEAEKTFEWRDGAGRLFAEDGTAIALSEGTEVLLAPWRRCVAAVNEPGALSHYPGSPEVARLLLRQGDRLRLNELHPIDYETLRARYAKDKRTAVTRLDALMFLKSQTPPPEKRGLILVDPPYEKTDEAAQAIRMLSESLKRFATGVYCLWYPVTGDGLDKRLRDDAASLGAKMLTAELLVRSARPDGGLAGSGVIVVNPPWKLDDELALLLPALAERLSQGAQKYSLDVVRS